MVIIIAGIFGALVTYFLNNKIQLGSVLASALISVLTAGFFFIFPELISKYLTANIPVVVMGSSFIGMATNRVISQYWIIGFSGLIFSVIFLFTGSFFEGFGGSLGTTASISLCSAFALNRLNNLIPFPIRS